MNELPGNPMKIEMLEQKEDLMDQNLKSKSYGVMSRAHN